MINKLKNGFDKNNMNNLFNGDYDVLLFFNEFNKIIKYNFFYFDNALYVMNFWIEDCEKSNDWYKSVIPIMIKKNGRCVARAKTYNDYYKYVLKSEV